MYKGKRRVKSREKLLKKITRYDDCTDYQMIGIETMGTLNILYPSDIMNEFVKLEFEDSTYMCVKQYKKALELLYGDYMTLPPVEERDWKHHPIILDFEKEYSDFEKH